MSPKNPWKTLASRLIYSNPWITVREDQVIHPDGTPGIYGVVDARIATGALALTADNCLYLVGQYRYPTNQYSWEIVEGGAEPGEAPLDAAKRELREEAGLIAAEWSQLGGEVHLSNCFSSEIGYLFLARGLTEVSSTPDGTEVLEIKRVPMAECLRMVDQGEIKDSVTIIGILRLARMLRSE
jgi:8-oxo-dGTP pyrophosphatase MutT (NUDIX family)